MSPTYIALIILFGVAIMAGIAFAVQDFENKKREKNLRLITLKTAIRRATHLLEAFPPILMTNEIHALLCKYLSVRWSAAVDLEPSETNKQQHAAFQALAANVPDAVSHPTGSLSVFTNSVEAARALGVIKEFAGFVAEIKNKGDIGADVADRLTKDAKRIYMRVEIDMDLINALETEETQGPDVVIHYYRSCFTKLQNLNHNQALDRQLYEIRTHITQLAEQIDQITEEKRLEEEKQKDSGKKFNF
ncbi:MAG: hypothetical protein GY845_24005 [Planctomycetes bacterium]|nr:hypothetical protein [Planctomycetota bacterium]